MTPCRLVTPKRLARAMAHTKQVKAVVPLNNGFTNCLPEWRWRKPLHS